MAFDFFKLLTGAAVVAGAIKATLHFGVNAEQLVGLSTKAEDRFRVVAADYGQLTAEQQEGLRKLRAMTLEKTERLNKLKSEAAAEWQAYLANEEKLGEDAKNLAIKVARKLKENLPSPEKKQPTESHGFTTVVANGVPKEWLEREPAAAALDTDATVVGLARSVR